MRGRVAEPSSQRKLGLAPSGPTRLSEVPAFAGMMIVYSEAMRPERLNPLFAETAGLKGVGPQLAKPLDKLGLTRVKDLAYHLPDRFVQRRAVANLDEAS